MKSVQEINSAIIQGTFTNDELTSMIDAVKFARSRLTNQIKFQVRKGSSVKFTSAKNGMTYQGTVEKVAIKYATVNTNLGRWKVPMNMLEVVA
jgi:hypothetical protein